MLPVKIVCRECGSKFPNELINNLKNNMVVYCENCGAENRGKDFNFEEPQTISKQNQLKSNIQSLKSKGKEVFKSLKQKWSEFKDKYQER